MKMKKIVATGSALALTAAVAVGGTLAWLQDDSNTLTNTFVWDANNNINLILDETEFDPETGAPTGGRTQTGNKYTIVPGGEALKDPQMDLTTETPSYLYVTIANGLGENVTLVNLEENGWVKIGTYNDADLYAYDANKDEVLNDALTTTENIKVFDKITFSSELDATSGGLLDNAQIVVNGYAVQADAAGEGGDAEDAWTATFGAPQP